VTTASFLHFLAAESSDSNPDAPSQRRDEKETAHPPMPAADAALIARLQSGDQEAFDTVVDFYASRLVRFATMYTHDADDAEDVVADVLSTLWAGRARLHVHGGLATYLFGAVRNRARQRHRNMARRESAGARFLAEGVSPGMGTSAALTDDPSVPDESADAQLDVQVAAAIDALPERARSAVMLRWYEQMSYEGVAGVLGVSVVAARQTVHRAILTLRRQLVGDDS
jgi:RNA polymerase sigma-70 factor (ECF subfamily)